MLSFNLLLEIMGKFRKPLLELDYCGLELFNMRLCISQKLSQQVAQVIELLHIAVEHSLIALVEYGSSAILKEDIS